MLPDPLRRHALPKGHRRAGDGGAWMTEDLGAFDELDEAPDGHDPVGRLESAASPVPRVSGSPLVGVLVGSASDVPTMQQATAILERFQVPHELRVISAHRNPDGVDEYARTAEERGLVCVICGAGMANHLAGAVAARTALPVIGVPLSGQALSGADALYSTVQMPKGIPVATVAIDGAMNAALLAVQILAVDDDDLTKGLLDHRAEMVPR